MGSTLYNAPFLQHQYLIGVLDGAQARSDHKCRAALHDCIQGLLNEILCLHVNARSRVIEYEYVGVEQQCTCYRDSLFLTTRERHAAFSDPRVVPIRQATSEIMETRYLCCRNDLFVASIGDAVGDVITQCCIEQENVL